MTLLDLCEAPDAKTFTARIAAYFRARPGQWIPASELEAVGGRQAWRTRVSDARRVYGLTIENRCRRMTTMAGGHWTQSEYRYVPAGVECSGTA